MHSLSYEVFMYIYEPSLTESIFSCALVKAIFLSNLDHARRDPLLVDSRHFRVSLSVDHAHDIFDVNA